MSSPVLPTVIFGTAELGELVAAYLTADGDPPVAFTTHARYKAADELQGLPVIAFEELPRFHPPDSCRVIVTVGYNDHNQARERVCTQVRRVGYELGSYISPRACVMPYAELGANVIVLEGAIVQAWASLGDGCILWSGAQVAHHSTLANWCFLAPNATVAGNVRIGHHSFLGANCTVRDGLTVAPFTLIGAGAVILRDTEDRGLYRASETTADSSRRSSDARL